MMCMSAVSRGVSASGLSRHVLSVYVRRFESYLPRHFKGLWPKRCAQHRAHHVYLGQWQNGNALLKREETGKTDSATQVTLDARLQKHL